MISRLLRVALAVVALLLAAAGPAAAHQGNPNYRSVVNGALPAQPGLNVQVLGYDNQLQVINRTGKPVVISGYGGEPYARLLPNGSVEVNRLSPAKYLNEDRFAATPVPRFASTKAPPQWQVLDKTGRFVWHDHRMHWMAKGLPPQVKNRDHKTKVFDYAIPMRVGKRPVRLNGTLFWVGRPSGFPIAALVSLVVLAALGVGAVAVIRRRRSAAPRTGGQMGEAW